LDTHERVKEVSRFVILIPHRDALKPFDAYRSRLFSAGFNGAYSFPLAAPLAAVSRPFSRQELKELAANIRAFNFTRKEIPRGCAKEEKKTGKIQSTKTAYAQMVIPYDKMGISATSSCGLSLKKEDKSLNQKCFSLLGVFLDITVEEILFPQTAREKLLALFSPPALCAALASPEEDSAFNKSPVFDSAPALSFRAASLANMAIRPLPGGDARYSFEWKIGPPVWLPKYARPGDFSPDRDKALKL